MSLLRKRKKGDLEKECTLLSAQSSPQINLDGSHFDSSALPSSGIMRKKWERTYMSAPGVSHPISLGLMLIMAKMKMIIIMSRD